MSDGTKPMLHQAETDARILAHMLRIYIEDDAKDPMMMERVIGKIEASMDAVRAIERERCATICEQTCGCPGDPGACNCQDAADAIRATK